MLRAGIVHDTLEAGAMRRLSRRLFDLVFVMWFMATVIFFLLRVIPGDPVHLLLGMDHVNQEAVASLRAKFGLDRPLLVQYFLWLGNIVQGDLGVSLRSGIPVSELMRSAVPVTFEVALFALTIGIGLSIPLGVAAARRQGGAADMTLTTCAMVGISTPSFVLALSGIYVFAVSLKLLPVAGYVPFLEDPIENLRRMVLPSLALGLVSAGILMRMMRRSVIDESGEDYVRTARAKGAGETRVFYGHILRNAMLPFVTLAGIEAGVLLSGTVITETIFALPGLGRLMVENILHRDYPVVQGAIFVISAIYVLVNFFVDYLYTVLDPRVKVD